MSTIIAINPKYQATINKFIMWNAKYDEVVQATDDNGGRKQENAYDKAKSYLEALPARERKNLAKRVCLTGY